MVFFKQSQFKYGKVCLLPSPKTAAGSNVEYYNVHKKSSKLLRSDPMPIACVITIVVQFGFEDPVSGRQELPPSPPQRWASWLRLWVRLEVIKGRYVLNLILDHKWHSLLIVAKTHGAETVVLHPTQRRSCTITAMTAFFFSSPVAELTKRGPIEILDPLNKRVAHAYATGRTTCHG